MMNDWMGLRPTPDQYRECGEYLCEAHSWYKHLPLLGGGQFVVFVSSDAGLGRLVAMAHSATIEGVPGYTLATCPEGPAFTDENPRLHYGWKTTHEYRRRFGYLDYMYRISPGAPYVRDVGPPVQLPDAVERRCSFVLYPYVSWTFAEIVALHAEALEQLRTKAAHPARKQVLELAHLANALQAVWSALSDLERDRAVSCGTDGLQFTSGEVSVNMRSYFDLHERVHAASSVLRAWEAEKIRRALAELDDWLLQAG